MGETFSAMRATVIIDGDCRERFIPLHSAGAKPLADHGVLVGGISELRTRYEIARPDPTFHLMLYTVDGNGWLACGGGTVPLATGDLLVVPAGVACHYGLFDQAWDIAWFHLADQGAWRALRADRAQVRPASEVTALRPACDGLLAEALRDDPPGRRLANLYAEVIAHLLEREVAAVADPRSLEVRHRLQELWAEVGARPDEAWTVAALAKRVHCSAVHFNRLCARHYGAKPMQMVFRLRMERVARLLVQTEDPLKRIADRVGYRTPFALSDAFKRWCGLRPDEYRSRAR